MCFCCQHGHQDNVPSSWFICSGRWIWRPLRFDMLANRGAHGSPFGKQHVTRLVALFVWLVKLRSNCQTRQCWPNINQDSVTALAFYCRQSVQKHVSVLFCCHLKTFVTGCHFSCLKSDQAWPQLAFVPRRHVTHFATDWFELSFPNFGGSSPLKFFKTSRARRSLCVVRNVYILT